MITKKLSAAIALSLASSYAVAQPYQGELRLGVGEANNADVVSMHGYGYFNQVQTQDRPLAEADFLGRNSNVNLQYVYADSDGGSGDAARLNLEYFVPNSIIYVGAHYMYASNDSSSSNDWGVTLGVTPMEGLLLTTTYMDDPGYDLNLHAKYVTKLAGQTAINVEAGYQDGGDFDDTLELAMDYFFDHTFSVGLMVESQNDTDFGVRTRKFFTPTFSAEASYTSVGGAGDDSFMVGASLRF